MTTTKADLVHGLQTVLREGNRVMAGFGPDDWKKPALDADEDGWTRKQVYCHITALAEITPGFIGGLASAPEGTDGAAGLDINALNAQMVAAKAALSEPELQAAFKTGFENLIKYVEGMSDEQLAGQRQFGELKGTLGDIMSGVLVLHSVAHIYGAGGSPLG
jgi:hypothetical protein